jgi:transcriptional regulator with XRE-family HTH domain
MATQRSPVGDQLRAWRTRRRRSQLDLALDADISPRHLSFLETGRSRPSRGLLLRLAERLKIPPRERNLLLHAAGFAPAYGERPLSHLAMAGILQAVERVLLAYAPFPALAINRHWELVAANAGLTPLMGDVAPHLLEPPVNILRLSLHPDGVAPRIANLPEWRTHIFRRLSEQLEATGDPILAGLLEELRSYPGGEAEHDIAPDGIALPLRILTQAGTLSFIGTVTVFGSPLDVTLTELAIEAFLPADAATSEALSRL